MLRLCFTFRRYVLKTILFFLFLFIFVACKNPENNTNFDPENPSGGTWAELNNLEQFKVILYSDFSRHSKFAEIAANSKIIVSAAPNNSGVTYYPTYYIDLPEIPDTNIPYNGQAIVTVIEANKVNKVFIPRLENIVINTAYLKIINSSIYSLSLQQGGNEKVPLGGRPSIIASGQNAAYEIDPGASSSYTVMRNTTTPIIFSANFTEFEKGKVYVFTYNGTSLVRTATWSIPSPSWPTAPKNVQAEALSSTSVRLSWDAVYKAESYRVYRAVGSATASYTQIADVNTHSFTNGVSSNQTYYYKVSAIKGSTKGEESSVVSVRTPPAAPQNFRVVGSGGDFVVLAWNYISGANSTYIYRSETQDGNYLKVGSSIAFNDSGPETALNLNLEPLTTYHYKVSTIAGGIESFQSGAISATTVAPIDFRVTGTTATSISLAWNSVNGATRYEIHRSDSENGTFTKIVDNVTGNNYVNSGISPNSTYYYKIYFIFNVQSNSTLSFGYRTVSATTKGQ